MEIFYESITSGTTRNLIIISFVMIFTDILTGYLKAIKNKKINSSISRDGYIKKIGWVVAIIVCRELAVTGLRLLLVEDGEVMAAAWPGKVKTATQMVAIILLFINNIPFNLINLPMDQIMLYACLIFTIYSGVDYFMKNSGVFKGSM